MTRTQEPPQGEPPKKRAKPKGRPAQARRDAEIARRREEEAARNRKIVVMRLTQRRQWADIAAEVGLTDRQCRSIYREFLLTNRDVLPEIDPLATLFEMYSTYDALIERYSAIAEAATGERKWSAAATALRGLDLAMQAQLELLQASGIMPRELGQLRVIHEQRVIVQRFVQVLNEHKVPEDVRDALIAVLDPPRNAALN